MAKLNFLRFTVIGSLFSDFTAIRIVRRSRMAVDPGRKIRRTERTRRLRDAGKLADSFLKSELIRPENAIKIREMNDNPATIPVSVRRVVKNDEDEEKVIFQSGVLLIEAGFLKV